MLGRKTPAERGWWTDGERSADVVEPDVDLVDKVCGCADTERTPVVDCVEVRVELLVGLDGNVVRLVARGDLDAVRTQVRPLDARDVAQVDDRRRLGRVLEERDPMKDGRGGTSGRWRKIVIRGSERGRDTGGTERSARAPSSWVVLADVSAALP